MDQVVVTGTGTHHKLKDSPVPVEVISQRDLQNANPSSFQDALVKLVPLSRCKPPLWEQPYT